jgi:hypothetical protein
MPGDGSIVFGELAGKLEQALSRGTAADATVKPKTHIKGHRHGGSAN